MYNNGAVPLDLRILRAALSTLILLLGGVACGRPSLPTDAARSPVVTATATGVEPSSHPSPLPHLSFEDSIWYQVDRVGDIAGNARRTLLFGTVTGQLRGRIPLGESAGGPEQGQEPFAVSDPQADGIFGRRVLVWGRDGEPGQIESVDLDTGEIDRLLQSEDIIHVATADAALSRLFFIVVDGLSHRALELRTALVDGADAAGLTFAFPAEAMTNASRYRLVANSDGSLLAVQSGEQGPIHVIDVEGDRSVEFKPGGPVIGFAGEVLIAYGSASDTGTRPLVAYAPSTLERVITEGVSSAQVVPGTDGDLVVSMRISEIDAGHEIEVSSVATGDASVAYMHEGAEIAPLLARRDRSFLGYSLPPDWVLLVDSFLPFIPDVPGVPKDPPESSYPLALNVRTHETIRIGPFIAAETD